MQDARRIFPGPGWRRNEGSGMDIVREVEESLRQQEPRSAAVSQPIADRPSARQRFRDGVRKLRTYYTSGFDLCKADFRVAQRMAMEGYTHEEICDAMYHESHEIEIRKGNRVAAYIELTVRKAEK